MYFNLLENNQVDIPLSQVDIYNYYLWCRLCFVRVGSVVSPLLTAQTWKRESLQFP